MTGCAADIKEPMESPRAHNVQVVDKILEVVIDGSYCEPIGPKQHFLLHWLQVHSTWCCCQHASAVGSGTCSTNSTNSTQQLPPERLHLTGHLRWTADCSTLCQENGELACSNAPRHLQL